MKAIEISERTYRLLSADVEASGVTIDQIAEQKLTDWLDEEDRLRTFAGSIGQETIE